MVESKAARGARISKWSSSVLIPVLLAVAPFLAEGRQTSPNDGAMPHSTTAAADPRLQLFREWLDRKHAGYGCDEGPAPFRNKTVELAYPGAHFYFVQTYARGIQPPFPNALSLVASVDDAGHVTPFRPGAPESYGVGLMRISNSKQARLAAAAVSILASCDPGERRWPYKPERFKAKRNSGGWKCIYSYDGSYSSWVRFDKKGNVAEFGGTAPPVP